MNVVDIDTAKAIDIIASSKSFADIITVLSAEEKEAFDFLAKLVHPDKTTHPNASPAMAKLINMRSEFQMGVLMEDEAGRYRFKQGLSITRQPRDTIETSSCLTSMGNFLAIQKLPTDAKRYIPLDMRKVKDTFEVVLPKRAVPISKIDKLDQVHVNWILSRLIEFVTHINNNGRGYVHCGLTPDSIFITPENHGIVVTSFYHSSLIDQKIANIDGNYKTWYPPQTFKYKTANSMIDLEMSKKIAIWLLGDKSGVGNVLKTTHNTDFMNFVTKQHSNPYECYEEYRAVLAKNWEKKFHTLNI